MPRILRRYSYATPLMALLLLSFMATLPAGQISALLPNGTRTPFHFADTSLTANLRDAAAQSPLLQKQRTVTSSSQANDSSVTRDQSIVAKAKAANGSLPLSFEVNEGQSDQKVKYLARGQGYGLFLASSGPVLSLTKGSQKDDISRGSAASGTDSSIETALVSWELVAANKSPLISGIDMLPGKSNYFRGSDPAKWRANVSTYSKVQYRDVYPGIDVVYYGNQRR